jgi:hypothetical protein
MITLANAAHADVEISGKPTSNMNCVSGVCTATANKAVLNVSDLANMLASGDVAVKTGSLAKDIDIDKELTWSSTSRLTLDAQQSVTLKKQITVAGQGALTVTTNDTGGAKAKTKTGEFIIVPERGSVQFWDLGSSLTIDGNSYTLVGDIKTLASDIAANPSGFYALAKPYDASVDGTYSTSPVQTQFNGTFEGLGNTVSALALQLTGHGSLDGLFALIGPQGRLQDIGVVNGSLKAAQDNGIGLLAGSNNGGIATCWASGFINVFHGVGAGGLVGSNQGLIANSHADVRLTGFATRMGGLVGYNYTTGITVSSYAFRSIALRNDNEDDVGGLVGENLGAVQNSFARNHVADGKNSDSNFGGLVGQNDDGARIENTYAAGRITIKGSGLVGGLIGFDAAEPGSIATSYWDLDQGVSDQTRGAGNIKNDPGIQGLTTEQMQTALPKGFSPKIWGQNPKVNAGFPYLLTAPPH